MKRHPEASPTAALRARLTALDALAARVEAERASIRRQLARVERLTGRISVPVVQHRTRNPVRQWALDNGYTIAKSGPIPQRVMFDYQAANPQE